MPPRPTRPPEGYDFELAGRPERYGRAVLAALSQDRLADAIKSYTALITDAQHAQMRLEQEVARRQKLEVT